MAERAPSRPIGLREWCAENAKLSVPSVLGILVENTLRMTAQTQPKFLLLLRLRPSSPSKRGVFGVGSVGCASRAAVDFSVAGKRLGSGEVGRDAPTDAGHAHLVAHT